MVRMYEEDQTARVPVTQIVSLQPVLEALCTPEKYRTSLLPPIHIRNSYGVLRFPLCETIVYRTGQHIDYSNKHQKQ